MKNTWIKVVPGLSLLLIAPRCCRRPSGWPAEMEKVRSERFVVLLRALAGR
jgi:hypothetical protein